MAAILKVWRQKSDSSIDANLLEEQFLPNFLPIRFETKEPYTFLKSVAQQVQEEEQDE